MKEYSDKIEKKYVLEGDLELVWDCLSDEDRVGMWQGQEVTLGSKIGEHISLFGGWVNGKIKKLEKGKFISYTWTPNDWSSDSSPSVVEFNLEKLSGKQTKVQVLHHTFPNQVERDNHEKGWDEHFFDPIIKFLKNSQ